MKDSFQNCHPIVNIAYFGLVISFSMLNNHPLIQGLSLLGALLYLVSTEGKKSLLFIGKVCLPMVCLTAFINPAFNHEGATILHYFPNGNPLTMESIFYGLSAGSMLITVVLWFASFHRVMTTDKLICLFGKILPALSLVISMTLRFVPKFKAQMSAVAEAQKSIGRDVSMGSLWHRTRIAITILSITITWSLENAIETADSMKSRGYGLKGRTAFSIYRMDERDRQTLYWLLFCGLFLWAGKVAAVFGFRYFPNIRYASLDWTTIPFYIVYFGLCMTPIIINRLEEKVRW